MPIYKIKNKLILFIHVPRTGGMTVEHHLRAHGTVLFRNTTEAPMLRVTAQHLHGEDLSAIFPAGSFDYVFMLVRNPFDRLRSVYAYQRSLRSAEMVLPFGPWLRLAQLRRNWKPHYRDNHLRPQTEFETLGAEVFRIEDGMERVFERLHELFGIGNPESIEVVNRSPRPLPRLTNSDIRLVGRIYRGDFERYGYDVDAGSGRDRAAD